MALFGKLKQAVSAVTGGGAKVFLTLVGQPSRQQPFHVQVKALVGDADLKVARVYVKVEGVETTVVRNVNVGNNMNRDVSGTETTWQQEYNIAPAQVLTGKQEYTWEGDIQIPSTVLPTYRGRNAQHEWRIQAGLDVAGNDPNSSWTAIEIQ